MTFFFSMVKKRSLSSFKVSTRESNLMTLFTSGNLKCRPGVSSAFLISPRLNSSAFSRSSTVYMVLATPKPSNARTATIILLIIDSPEFRDSDGYWFVPTAQCYLRSLIHPVLEVALELCLAELSCPAANTSGYCPI